MYRERAKAKITLERFIGVSRKSDDLVLFFAAYLRLVASLLASLLLGCWRGVVVRARGSVCLCVAVAPSSIHLYSKRF